MRNTRKKIWQMAVLLMLLQLAAFALPEHVVAERHALLIGISKYTYVDNPLDGPVYDVELVSQTLQQLGFDRQRIVSLINANAGKQAILDAIEHLQQTTNPGDFIFIYFSGHGTSAFDTKLNDKNKFGMSSHSGAIIPADIKAGNVQEVKNGLLIGNLDLRPRLEKLEQGRDVLVAFDSCFSGFAVRSISSEKTNRYMPLNDLLGGGGAPEAYGSQVAVEQDDGGAYPYRRVMYLAASSPNETADDIGWPLVRSGKQTVDGKPHGAFTDTLVRAMQGAADGNRDRRLSVNEIYQYVRKNVFDEHGHTPQLLKADSVSGNEPIFTLTGAALTPASTWMTDENRPLRLEAKGLSVTVQSALKNIPGAEVVLSGGDLLLTKKNGGFEIYLKNGALLCRIDSESGLLARIKSQLALRKLTRIGAMANAYNVFLNLADGQGVLTEGEKIGVELSAEQKSFLLLFNVNPGGLINIVHPYYENELAITDKISLPDMGEVSAPHFGTEQMVAIAFRTEPPFWRQLPAMAKRGEVENLPPTDPLVEKIMQAVNGQAFAGGTVVSIQSTAKEDIVRQ